MVAIESVTRPVLDPAHYPSGERVPGTSSNVLSGLVRPPIHFFVFIGTTLILELHPGRETVAKQTKFLAPSLWSKGVSPDRCRSPLWHFMHNALEIIFRPLLVA